MAQIGWRYSRDRRANNLFAPTGEFLFFLHSTKVPLRYTWAILDSSLREVSGDWPAQNRKGTRFGNNQIFTRLPCVLGRNSFMDKCEFPNTYKC